MLIVSLNSSFKFLIHQYSGKKYVTNPQPVHFTKSLSHLKFDGKLVDELYASRYCTDVYGLVLRRWLLIMPSIASTMLLATRRLFEFDACGWLAFYIFVSHSMLSFRQWTSAVGGNIIEPNMCKSDVLWRIVILTSKLVKYESLTNGLLCQ